MRLNEILITLKVLPYQDQIISPIKVFFLRWLQLSEDICYDLMESKSKAFVFVLRKLKFLSSSEVGMIKW